MRLIGTFQDPAQGELFSKLLTAKGIENQFDVAVEKDWGSTDYGTASCLVWAYEEDDMEAAQKWYQEFKQNPTLANFEEAPEEKLKNLLEPLSDIVKKTGTQRRVEQPLTSGIGPVTLYFTVLCTLLLLYGTFTSPLVTKLPPNIPSTPLLSPPINKTMLYDYPQAYEIIDRIVRAYGIEALQNPSTLPLEGQLLLQQSKNTPYWRGFYEKLLTHFKNDQAPWEFNAPLFEKIRQGEFWRLFSPALLHGDLFHLIFNMLWLLVVGKQMEQKMGPLRYLFFILIAGIFSNTAQYLMGGSNFIGFSGVLCAMIVFVWIRQRHAAWENYHIASSSFLFIALFIGLLFLVQVFSFFLEGYNGTSFAPSIANTAHLSGAFIGWVMGHMSYFNRQ